MWIIPPPGPEPGVFANLTTGAYFTGCSFTVGFLVAGTYFRDILPKSLSTPGASQNIQHMRSVTHWFTFWCLQNAAVFTVPAPGKVTKSLDLAFLRSLSLVICNPPCEFSSLESTVLVSVFLNQMQLPQFVPVTLVAGPSVMICVIRMWLFMWPPVSESNGSTTFEALYASPLHLTGDIEQIKQSIMSAVLDSNQCYSPPQTEYHTRLGERPT